MAGLEMGVSTGGLGMRVTITGPGIFRSSGGLKRVYLSLVPE